MSVLKGLGVSPGAALGRAVIVRQAEGDLRVRLVTANIESEVARLERAQDASRRQLESIRERVAGALGRDHAYLFDAQLLMVDDPMLAGRATELVRADGINAEWALARAAGEVASRLEGIEDPYFRERTGDIADVVGRIRLNLRGDSGADVMPLVGGPWILVADDLPPSVAAQLNWESVVGFASDRGSWTHHTAILARSLGIPAVVALGDASERIVPGTVVLLDGALGTIEIDPEATAAPHPATKTRRPQPNEPDGPATTADGVAVRLFANIETPDAARWALEWGAEGIGLFRTDFLAGPDGTPAGEDALVDACRTVLDLGRGREITIRTRSGPSSGPDGPIDDALRTQIRAILRAASYGTSDARILVPAVRSADEIDAIRRLAADLARDLALPPLPVGAMVEIPSAVLLLPRVAEGSAFLSVGTNDLTAHCLGIDRSATSSTRPLAAHPAALRLLRSVPRVARRTGRRVAVCGEMAAQSVGIVLLVGLGFRELSMAPVALPAARRLIGRISAREAASLARRVSTLSSSADASGAVLAWLEEAGVSEVLVGGR